MCSDSGILSASVLFDSILPRSFYIYMSVDVLSSYIHDIPFPKHSSTIIRHHLYLHKMYTLRVVVSSWYNYANIRCLCTYIHVGIKTKGKIFHLMDGSNFMLLPTSRYKRNECYLTDDDDYIINHHLVESRIFIYVPTYIMY